MAEGIAAVFARGLPRRNASGAARAHQFRVWCAVSGERFPVFVPDYGRVAPDHALTLAVGDRVRRSSGGLPGTVAELHVKRGHVMFASVDWDSGEASEYDACVLSHADFIRR